MGLLGETSKECDRSFGGKQKLIGRGTTTQYKGGAGHMKKTAS